MSRAEPYEIRYSQWGSDELHYMTVNAVSQEDALHRARCELGNRMIMEATREADIPVARWQQA